MPLNKAINVKIRPLANASLEKATLKGAAQLYVAKDALIELTGTLDNGKACTIERIAEGEESGIKREACLYVQNVSANVVQMSRAFQEAAGFKMGDLVKIEALDRPIPEAEKIFIEDVTEQSLGDGKKREKPLDEGNREEPIPWRIAALEKLERAEQAFPGMVIEGASLGRFRRSYKVVSIDGRQDGLANVNVEKTKVRILQPGEADGLTQPRGDLTLTDVPGFEEQVRKINRCLFRFKFNCGAMIKNPTCALMIEGGEGTGKTFLLEKLASTNWGRVFRIEESDKSAAVREKFTQARAQQPSIILIDDIQTIVSSEGTDRKPVIAVLREELDSLSVASAEKGILSPTLVVATCIDRLKDVPKRLKESGRFSQTIVLPIPKTPERLEILRYHATDRVRENERDAILGKLAEETYAYSCRDLENLVSTAMLTRLDQLQDSFPSGEIPPEELFVRAQDFVEAKRQIPASLMQDIHLQPQTVKWEDIGGQEDIKNILSRMIKQTKETHKPSFVRKPDKGLLLYGPPGCSKTLSARAMATESGFNFFSVKAGELLNMYVGESERQVREVFARARAASPAIIFFDEIESIAKARSGGSGTTNSGSGGVNTLTSLLTEMDGFEALSGVLIIAATNKPETIDTALMRPGRFSKVVYVGPPDQTAREAIFRVHLRGQPLAADVDFTELAVKTDGHSGSEIESIVNETEQVLQARVDDAEDDSAVAAAEIRREDLLNSISKTPKTITKEVLDGFDRWGKRAGFKKQESLFG